MSSSSVSLWTGNTDLSKIPSTTRRIKIDEKADNILAAYPIIGSLSRADFRPVPGFQIRAKGEPQAVNILGYDPARRIAYVTVAGGPDDGRERFVPEFLIGTKLDGFGSVKGEAWKLRALRRSLGLLAAEAEIVDNKAE